MFKKELISQLTVKDKKRLKAVVNALIKAAENGNTQAIHEIRLIVDDKPAEGLMKEFKL